MSCGQKRWYEDECEAAAASSFNKFNSIEKEELFKKLVALKDNFEFLVADIDKTTRRGWSRIDQIYATFKEIL